MTEAFSDDRIQFFLRHREEILEWAGIERDVLAATRELLASAQPILEERLLQVAPDAVVARRDNGQWERVVARRPNWPDWFGVTLEWERSVDPFGRSLPKMGVIFLADTDDRRAIREKVVAAVQASGRFEALGYKVAAGVWPAVRYLPASKVWWQDTDQWLAQIVEDMLTLWDRAAPVIDRALEA